MQACATGWSLRKACARPRAQRSCRAWCSWSGCTTCCRRRWGGRACKGLCCKTAACGAPAMRRRQQRSAPAACGPAHADHCPAHPAQAALQLIHGDPRAGLHRQLPMGFAILDALNSEGGSTTSLLLWVGRARARAHSRTALLCGVPGPAAAAFVREELDANNLLCKRPVRLSTPQPLPGPSRRTRRTALRTWLTWTTARTPFGCSPRCACWCCWALWALAATA